MHKELPGKETIAVIDLGTNTFQMLIAQADRHNHFKVLRQISEPVRLGEGGIGSGWITQAAFTRGIAALKSFRQLINVSGATAVLAIATSAIRSAENGRAFVETALHEAGIAIKVIDGLEEAELIHEGVKGGLQLPAHDPALLMDIGGGSVEFILSQGGVARYMRSLNIGAARLIELARPGDPMSAGELHRLQQFLYQQMRPLARELAPFGGVSKLIGSSSTFKTLGLLVSHAQGAPVSRDSLNGYQFQRDAFLPVYEQLLHSTRESRAAMYQMKKSRIEMIVPATIIVHTLLDLMPELEEITVSTSALREGILWRYLLNRKR